MRGYKQGRFSFNVKGGRCEACRGDGIIKIEMHFLPDVYVPCEVCKGARYNRETLEVKYKGKSIADVLDMTVDDAVEFFSAIPKINRKMVTLQEVGLGYIRLGQAATTLSGGEAQRVKLATELARRSTGKTLYILDEPTTGLHAEDIRKLLHVLQQLVEGGDTVVVIEHNLDVIKMADHIIDLGPEGGNRGGTIVATGTPEEIVKVKESYTGKFLGPVLEQTKKFMKAAQKKEIIVSTKLKKSTRKGGHMPSEELLEKVSHLPTTPGVYLWRDQYNRIIYVGKPLICATACVPMCGMMRTERRRIAAMDEACRRCGDYPNKDRDGSAYLREYAHQGA